MDRQRTVERWWYVKTCPVLTCSLLAALLLFNVPALAAVPQHRNNEPPETNHAQNTASGDMSDLAHEKRAEVPVSMGEREGTDQKSQAAESSEAGARVSPGQSEDSAAKVGLDEKLGTHIPLDLTFLDEQGKPVKLADLITMPRIPPAGT